MQTLDLIQGSPEWLSARAQYFTASEAPAMLGLSKYKTRQELLREKATGITPEVSARTQHLFDKGHEAEAAARPLAEELIGEELYPATGVLEVEGLQLLASFDGITMDESQCWENKMFNAEFAAYVRDEQDAPDTHWPQLEQQLLVSGASRVLFTVGDESVWYVSRPERRAQLIAGWKQFAEDVANYQHVETAAPAVGSVVKDLPAVMVHVSGQVSIIDNFSLFETALRDFIDNRLVRKPQSDQDFADLGEQIASLKKAEAALDAAEVQMLSQVESVDAMKRTKDMLHKLARDNRLVAEKLLAAEKENRKAEIVRSGVDALVAHVSALSERIGQTMPIMQGNFGGVIKGLKSLDSMRSNVADELARMKIETNATADRIEANKKTVEDMSLFPDFAAVCTKAPEDFAALLAMRVGQRKAAEEKRIEEGRAKIRAEEQAKAQREADAKAAAEREAHRQADAAEREAQAKEAARIAAQSAAAQKVIDDAAAEAKRAAEADAAQKLHDLAAQQAEQRLAEKSQPAPAANDHNDGRVEMLISVSALAEMMDARELGLFVHYGERLIQERRATA